MALLPAYQQLLDLPERLASPMLAQLPAGAQMPGVTDVLARLERADLELSETEVLAVPETEDARWQLEARLQARPGVTRRYTIWAEATEKLGELHLEWHALRPEDVEASKASNWSIGVSTSFGARPLDDFHAQVRLLHVLVPDAVAAFDIAAAWPRPGMWLGEVASSSVPPGPENLFCVHAVHNDASDPGVWLHSHGLLRCGTFELEMLRVPREHASTLCYLLNAAASRCIEQGPPAPEEPFAVGSGLDLVWLPWEQGIEQVPSRSHGGRADRDAFHARPSAVLFAPKKKLLGLFGSRYQSPACYLPALEDNPILYVSHMETERMQMLAHERLGAFLALQAQHGDKDGWLFLVKLGYPVDSAEHETDREHLWFRVHTADAKTVEATLLNEPYGIEHMHEGDRASHRVDLMSDWAILCEHGRFNPDTVVHLERLLQSGAG